MTTTYVAITTTTVGASNAATIDFNSIPSTYTDLLLAVSARSTLAGGSAFNITFNGSTSSYTNMVLQGNGSSPSSYSNYVRFAGLVDLSTETTSAFASNIIYIPSYTSSNNKSYYVDAAGETNSTTAYMVMIAGLWSNTAAITSITLTPVSGSFTQYSTATLYGISNA